MEVVRKFARKASSRIARREVRRHTRQSPREVFQASWDRLLSRRLYRLFVRLGQNSAREGTQLRGRTFELLAADIPDFLRATKIKISGALKHAVESGNPFVAVHIHDGHRFLSRVFAEQDRDVTRIVSDPSGYLRWLRGFGVDTSRIHAIKDDVLSLAHLRTAVRNGHVLCSALDYTDAKGRRAYINPAIFGFANRSNIPVYFVKAHVNEDGSAELIGAGPYCDVDPMTCASNFLDFFNSVGESRIKMRIKRYNEHEDWRTDQRYQPKNGL